MRKEDSGKRNRASMSVKKRLLSAIMACLVVVSAIPHFALADTGEIAYLGLGAIANFREGPGRDETGTPVYSFNHTFAVVLFDADGKIIDVETDILEVSTPNYDGASMPHFTGWPTSKGYNWFDHGTDTIQGPVEVTVESATAEVEAWKTKRERGDTYGMKEGNDWFKQMDFFEEWFKGQTVAELNTWMEKNSTAAGRPIKANTTNEAELAKLAKLTDAEKAALADVVAGATMSLEDPHGLIVSALQKAYDNKIPVRSQDIASLGLGCDSIFRNGPGQDEDGNPRYSFNVVTSGVAFDSNGAIATTVTDILEVCTPNYDGTSMPFFLGWPGTQIYFTYDHSAQKIAAPVQADGSPVLVDIEAAKTVGSAWITKRDRGDAYAMKPGNDWYQQMNFFQDWMVGKTMEELNTWFDRNTTVAGRPIKANTTNEADKEKYGKLYAAERYELADVVAGATMSLEDPHGRILSAMNKACASVKEVK